MEQGLPVAPRVNPTHGYEVKVHTRNLLVQI
jgi:hypothetical protein